MLTVAAARVLALVGCLAVPLTARPAAPAAAVTSRYDGLCDASAAEALGPDHFVVADDEHDTLAVYRRGRPAPVARVPLAGFLGTGADGESDIEGAATIGSRIYWITSHGRNKNGKERPSRYRLFATDIDLLTDPPSLRPVGTPYTRLLGDLIAAVAKTNADLADAAQRAPESPGGSNIEGLAATPDGRLLIGFRNPIPAGRALVVRLDNPEAVVAGRPAALGPTTLLDLGGRGIRSLERVGGAYFVVAGPPADAGSFALYRWSGKSHDAPAPVAGIDFGDLHPEALFEVPGSGMLQMLSDDGGFETKGVACKALDPSRRSFRSLSIKTP